MSDSNKRLAYFLPNIFTAMNMACGFAAILMAMQDRFSYACYILVLGAIFDSVDGRIARLTGTQSSFGEQFDSMSDLISFGMSPAILFYLRFLTEAGRLGMVVTFFYILCGALRLARFNANIEKVSAEYFQGMPIPGTAIGLISFVFLSLEFPFLKEFEFICIPYILVYSILMISNIPFPSFKNSEWVRRHRKGALFIVLLVFASLFIYEEVMVGVVITLYVLGSVFYYLMNRKKFVGMFSWSND